MGDDASWQADLDRWLELFLTGLTDPHESRNGRLIVVSSMDIPI